MDELDAIQSWHKGQCERGRDRKLGVHIGPLQESPGWTVRIDLAGTALAELQIPPYKEGDGERDWLMYRVKDEKFEGAGDPTKLRALLFAFLELSGRFARKPHRKKA